MNLKMNKNKELRDKTGNFIFYLAIALMVFNTIYGLVRLASKLFK